VRPIIGRSQPAMHTAMSEKMSEKMKAFVVQHIRSEGAKLWGGFALFVLGAFWFFSSGDFSFLLTLSAIVGMFSFLMVASKIEGAKSVKGVSLKMMECYTIVCMARLCAIVPFEGYLPFDKSGDWLYQVTEAVSFCLAGSIVYLVRFRYASTYDSSDDTFRHLYLILPSLVLALILHPKLNDFMPSDIAWAFALYLESVTVLPQLFMFMRGGKAEDFTSHFLAAQATSKLISFIFWASSFSELANNDHVLKSFVGNWVVAMQLVQLLVMGDFIYHYIRCIRKGIPVSLLVCADNV